MIVGGVKGLIGTIEIIDMNDLEFSCVIQSSLRLKFPSSFILDGDIVNYATIHNGQGCSIIKNQATTITLSNIFQQSRSKAQGVYVPYIDGRWFVSGQSADMSSEILFSNMTATAGPPYEESNRDHCPIQLNDTHTLISGGLNTLRMVKIYDWTQKTWTDLPNLKINRYGHGCTLNPSDNMVYIVGGWDGSFNKFETLLLDGDNEWFIEKDLSEPVGGCRLEVVDSKRMYLFGGATGSLERYDTIYKFDFESREWKLSDFRLNTPRSNFDIFPVSNFVKEKYCS